MKYFTTNTFLKDVDRCMQVVIFNLLTNIRFLKSTVKSKTASCSPSIAQREADRIFCIFGNDPYFLFIPQTVQISLPAFRPCALSSYVILYSQIIVIFMSFTLES